VAARYSVRDVNPASIPGEAVIGRLFWELVGYAPEPERARALALRLMDAVPVETVRAEIAASPEAQRRRRRLGEAKQWQGNEWSVPYIVREDEAPKQLVVTFAGLTVGETPPRLIELDNPSIARLAVGMGALIPRTADEMAGWSRDVARLVRVVAEDLGVSEQAVTFCGPSGEGTYALIVGFSFGTGTVIAGAPGVRLGTWMMRLWEGLKHHPTAGPPFVWSYVRSGAAQASDPVVLLDDLIPRLAREVSGQIHVALYAAPHDFVYEDSVELLERSCAWPNVTVRLVHGVYADHNDIRAPFRDFVAQYLDAR
jgi:hypothetical protein